MKTKNKGLCTSAIGRATMSPCNEKRNTESGRSMVEMLGVLAIMGILSIGGIAGFNYAMNKHRANTLLNEASKRAVVVTGQINMLGRAPSLQEFTNNQWGYGAFENTVYGADGTAGWTKADKQFTLSVTGVSEGVCAQMQKAVAKPIQSFQPETCAAENNTVKLTYNNDMSGRDITPAKPTYESCVAEGRCTYDRGKYHCLNGAANPPYCTEDCPYGCDKEGYTCFGSYGCSCHYEGTYPNCNSKPACIDDGTCRCEQVSIESFGCYCSYGGTYPNCNIKPDCITAGLCQCDIHYGGGSCSCTYDVGTYPNCSKPACTDDGTCSCSDGSCVCAYNVGTYPNCSKPACIDDGTCDCYPDCSCKCGGTYPDNCDKPSCLDNGTCLCGYGEHYCVNGGTYPDNCNDKPACLDDGTCYCQMVGGLGFLPCSCNYGGTYPNCNPAP